MYILIQQLCLEKSQIIQKTHIIQQALSKEAMKSPPLRDLSFFLFFFFLFSFFGVCRLAWNNMKHWNLQQLSYLLITLFSRNTFWGKNKIFLSVQPLCLNCFNDFTNVVPKPSFIFSKPYLPKFIWKFPPLPSKMRRNQTRQAIKSVQAKPLCTQENYIFSIKVLVKSKVIINFQLRVTSKQTTS